MLRILYFYDHQISITKHFSKILVILYGKRYLKYFRYGQDMHGYNKTPPPPPPPPPYLNHLQVINHSFLKINKISNNEIKEIFCERLK